MGAAPPREFPSSSPATLRAEATSLPSLVHHRASLEADTELESALAAFRAHAVDYMAVVANGRVIGLCSRGQIGFIMGSRFGFALYSNSAVQAAMVPEPFIVRADAPVRDVLDRALARRGERFTQDVVLVDADDGLIGLIKAETLAQLQSQLVAEQLDALRAQHDTLRQQNLELFRAIHAARQSKGLYLGLFEGHALGVALLDVEGGIHEHNRRLVELLGLNDAPASLVSLVAWVDEKERATFLELLRSHAGGQAGSSTCELTLNVPGRGARLFRCSTGWIAETGQVCACLDDITDQRLLERKLLRQEKQTLLDTLVGGIAHELNNKLTPVHGFAELLTFDAGDERQVFARYIQSCVSDASHIIRQLLQLSKPSAPTMQAVDLRTLLEETLVMLRFQVRAARCDVRSLVPPDPVWVLGDAAQLKQVVLNLVLNALQSFEGRGESLLSVGVAAAGGMASLIVSDNGCGIPPENLGRIFDPFFTTKGPERGTGLGLSICYSIVRQHGGEIAVESRFGRGTTFTVKLPREQVALFRETVCEESRVPVAPPEPSPSGRGRVLIVEDDEVVRMLLQEMLRRHFGCEVDLATNGCEALAALERQPYELVLSDVQMHEMNGTELFARARERWPEIAEKFVFITGYPGGPHLETQIAQWKVPVIAKPFTFPKLAGVCGPILNRMERSA